MRCRTIAWSLVVCLVALPAHADDSVKRPVGAAMVGLGVAVLLADAALLFATGASSFKIQQSDLGGYPENFSFTAHASLLAAGNLLIATGTPIYLVALDDEPHPRRLAAGVALTFIGLAALTAGIVTAIDSTRLPDSPTGDTSVAQATQASFGLGTTVAGNALVGVGLPLLFDGLPKHVRPSGLGIAGSF